MLIDGRNIDVEINSGWTSVRFNMWPVAEVEGDKMSPLAVSAYVAYLFLNDLRWCGLIIFASPVLYV